MLILVRQQNQSYEVYNTNCSRDFTFIWPVTVNSIEMDIVNTIGRVQNISIHTYSFFALQNVTVFDNPKHELKVEPAFYINYKILVIFAVAFGVIFRFDVIIKFIKYIFINLKNEPNVELANAENESIYMIMQPAVACVDTDYEQMQSQQHKSNASHSEYQNMAPFKYSFQNLV